MQLFGQLTFALLLARACGLSAGELGLRLPRRDSRKSLFVAAALWADVAVGFTVLFPAASALEEEAHSTRMALQVLQLCVAVPLAEELLFRGVVQAGLRRMGWRWAFVAQAGLFAVLHGTPAAMLYALAMGLVFGWAAEACGSLWPGVVLHMINNGMVLAGEWLAERNVG